MSTSLSHFYFFLVEPNTRLIAATIINAITELCSGTVCGFNGGADLEPAPMNGVGAINGAIDCTP